ALGDLIPPLLLLRGPDLGTPAIDAGELVILVIQWGVVRVVRSLLAQVGGDRIARNPGSSPGFSLTPRGVVTHILRYATISLRHDALHPLTPTFCGPPQAGPLDRLVGPIIYQEHSRNHTFAWCPGPIRRFPAPAGRERSRWSGSPGRTRPDGAARAG